MKLKQGFILRKIAGEHVLIPTGAENISNYNGVITINKTTAFLCGLLKEEQTKESLIKALLEKYDVGEELATKDVDQLLSLMAKHQMLED